MEFQIDSMENSNQVADLNPLFVIIIGGGLGGLATALALQKKNIECQVFERDKEISTRRQGYGLTLTNNVKGPLAQLVILSFIP